MRILDIPLVTTPRSLSSSTKKFWIREKQAKAIEVCGTALNIKDRGEVSSDKSESEVKAVETDRLPPLRRDTAMKTPKVTAGVRYVDILAITIVSSHFRHKHCPISHKR
jgi:hypothetical protein